MKGGGGERGEERPNVWRSKGRCRLLSMPPHLFSLTILSLQQLKGPTTIGLNPKFTKPVFTIGSPGRHLMVLVQPVPGGGAFGSLAGCENFKL